MYTRMGRIKKAEQYITKALALNNRNAEFYTHYGVVLFGEKRHAEALEAVQKGLELEKTHTGAWLAVKLLGSMGKNDEAIKTLEQYRSVLKDDYEILYGELLFATGRYKKAIPYFEEALKKKESGDYSLLEKIGSCYKALGELDSAEKYFIQSIETEEMNPRAQFNLAEIYFTKKRYQEAANIYVFLTDHWGDKRIYYSRLADCYANMNQEKKAENIRKKILPGMPEEL